jgi:hypothetical protein
MQRTLLRRSLPGLVALAALTAAPQSVQSRELLIVLTETDQTRNGHPVLKLHENPTETTTTLTRGLSGLILRLYELEQSYLARADGITPEPAYILLSSTQGGFPRQGFYLEEQDKSSVGYVDVHKEGRLAGRFGAMDQIFPHELAHVMRRQLAGELEDGGTNQVHAIGVRTDPVVAFNEGFAEHLQTMAIEHPDAHPDTAALLQDAEAYPTVLERLDEYRRELTARVAVAPRMSMGFVAWFSNGEDVLRYHAVKANAFQHEVSLPPHLLTSDPYRAYLLENILLDDPQGAVRPLPRLLSTEGAISAFFYRWATDDPLRSTYRDEPFYELFGTSAAEVQPELNVYLKILHVFYLAKPQRLLDFVEGYESEFPDEAERVGQIAQEIFGTPVLRRTPEIWMANPDFETGTTVFDQFRGLPRTHTFDLNAASVVDLVAVAGVTPELARAIRNDSPFDTVDDLTRVEGISAALVERFREMVTELDRLRAELEEETEQTLSIRSILTPYLWRAGGVLLLAAAFAGLLHRTIRLHRADPATRFSWWRTAVNGLAASLVSLLAGWILGPGHLSFLAVGLMLGIPATIWCGARTRRGAVAGRVFIAWLVAAVPGVLLIVPWF